jgi:acyl-CoA synthetase (AMP-forming)/AMP-acid ligase II
MARPDDLWSLLEWRASMTPDAEACVERSGRRLTFAELLLAAASQAGGLSGLGMRAGDTVVWELPTSVDAAILTLALRRLGVRQVPVIAIYRDREVRHCCAETGASWLLTGGPFRGFDFDEMGDRISGELGLRHLTTQSLPSAGLDQTLGPVADPDADLWVFYTSGTTAAPKGARHSDRTLGTIGSAMARALQLEPSDRYALVFLFPHVGGIVLLFSGLLAGCCHLLDDVFDPQQTPAFLAAEDVTHAGTGTPFHLAYLDAQRRQPDRMLFPRLKCCPGGAAPKPPTLHEQVKQELGGVGIVSSWGLTEAPILTFADFGDPDEKLATTEGRPLPGVELRTVRPDGTPLAIDAEGELQARGPHVMAGYVDGTLDREVFTSDGWFRTGDLGIIDGQGYVQITGRLKDVIIRNGENISAKEVEDLLFAHPKVADASVIGIPDPATGERVCAVVVATDSANPLELGEMAAYLHDIGLRTQAIPERLEHLSVLPRNPAGKIPKDLLREQVASGVFA